MVKIKTFMARLHYCSLEDCDRYYWERTDINVHKISIIRLDIFSAFAEGEKKVLQLLLVN